MTSAKVQSANAHWSGQNLPANCILWQSMEHIHTIVFDRLYARVTSMLWQRHTTWGSCTDFRNLFLDKACPGGGRAAAAATLPPQPGIRLYPTPCRTTPTSCCRRKVGL